jgi:hypothetical protein
MNIISTTDVSRYGNDVYIEESYSLIEQFGLYAVIRFYKVSGWTSQAETSIIISTTNESEAKAKYKEYCKYFKK